jgi:predicted dehydrogenase
MLLSTDNGVPVQLLAAWRRGGGPCDDELTIYGDKGTLRVWAWRGWQFEPLARDEAVEKRECYLPSDHIGTRVRVGVTGALREFVTAIAEHRQPVPSAQDALSAQQLVELLYQNTQCGGLER